jgi:hypothetical protein
MCASLPDTRYSAAHVLNKKLFNFSLGGDGRPSAHFSAPKGGGCASVSQGAQKVLSTGYPQGQCAVKNLTGPRCTDCIDRKGFDASAFLFPPPPKRWAALHPVCFRRPCRRSRILGVSPSAAEGLSDRDSPPAHPQGGSLSPGGPYKPGPAQGNDCHRGYLGKET